MYAAIDPMAMILSPKALDIWYQIHHPHAPKVSAIQEVLKGASPEELKATLSRAKALVEYGRVVEEAITTLK